MNFRVIIICLLIITLGILLFMWYKDGKKNRNTKEINIKKNLKGGTLNYLKSEKPKIESIPASRVPKINKFYTSKIPPIPPAQEIPPIIILETVPRSPVSPRSSVSNSPRSSGLNIPRSSVIEIPDSPSPRVSLSPNIKDDFKRAMEIKIDENEIKNLMEIDEVEKDEMERM